MMPPGRYQLPRALLVAHPACQMQAFFTNDILWVGPTVPPEMRGMEGNPTGIYMDVAQSSAGFGLGGNDCGFYMEVRPVALI